MAFLDGNQPDRLCDPMMKYIEARGGEVRTNAPLQEFITGADGSIEVRSNTGAAQ
jgi:15-cis-phytoene desaturase